MRNAPDGPPTNAVKSVLYAGDIANALGPDRNKSVRPVFCSSHQSPSENVRYTPVELIAINALGSVGYPGASANCWTFVAGRSLLRVVHVEPPSVVLKTPPWVAATMVVSVA